MSQRTVPPTESAAQIADALGETAVEPRARIARAVRILGAERVSAFADQARESEQGEGLLTTDGSRRRTLGGVFFYLMKGGISREERWSVFPQPPRKKGSKGAKGAKGKPGPEPTFEWFHNDATWQGIIEELLSENAIGEGRVKAAVVGRPLKVQEQGGAVLVGLKSTVPTSFPKGVPTPTAEATKYMLIVSAKQWTRVAEALKAPDDLLIAEGYGTLDPRFTSGITVHVQSITTKNLQAAKRQATDSA